MTWKADRPENHFENKEMNKTRDKESCIFLFNIENIYVDNHSQLMVIPVITLLTLSVLQKTLWKKTWGKIQNVVSKLPKYVWGRLQIQIFVPRKNWTFLGLWAFAS